MSSFATSGTTFLLLFSLIVQLLMLFEIRRK